MRKSRIRLSRSASNRKFRRGAKVNSKNTPRTYRGGLML